MTYKAINEEIVVLQKDYIHPDIMERKLQKAKQLLEDVQHEVYSLEKVLEKEKLDVEKLEGKSMGALFYKFLGMKEKLLEREREEALVAKLKYEASKESETNLKKDIEILLKQQSMMKEIQERLESLKREQLAFLKSSNTPEAQKMQDLETQIEALRSEIKELKEAIIPAKAALSALEAAIKSLGSAENWGMYDMLGGGLIADMAKHSKIDDSRNHIMTAQKHLQKLQVELRDVKVSGDTNITITQGATLADIFFDGLIADWYMQSKINQSQQNVVKVRSHVAQLILKLEQTLSQREKEVKQKQLEIETLLESIK